MLVVFYSLSGNVARLVRSLPFDHARIGASGMPVPEVDQDFVLVTPTYTDRIPAPVERFMDYAIRTGHECLGVIGSGNRNFGADYCAAARLVAQRYSVPVLHELEVWGTDQDHQTMIDTLNHLSNTKAPV
jgi:protein involved in ribonucleotide reduction